ncbi:hypothetical protein BH09PSE2_BH09PSE2_05470 [soil metagenome]
MTDTLETLRLKMEQAAADMDFEEAARLRDQLSLLQGADDPDTDRPIDTTRLTRQEPGRMGLGTSDQKMTPSADWKPPKRPDPLTSIHKRPKHRR